MRSFLQEMPVSLQQLEADLSRAAATNGSLNQLADLLDLATATNVPQDTSKAIYTLYRVFVLVITGDKLVLGSDDAARAVKTWLWDRLNAYVGYLGSLLKDEEESLRVCLFHNVFCLVLTWNVRYRLSRSSCPFKSICPHHTPS